MYWKFWTLLSDDAEPLSTASGPYLVHALVRQSFSMAMKRLKEANRVESFKDHFKTIIRQSLQIVFLSRSTSF